MDETRSLLDQKQYQQDLDDRAREKLGDRFLVFVGLMGAGKSAIGRRVASRLNMPFLDADQEIEAAAGKDIADIFAEHGEAYFRDGEEKVIERLLKGSASVLATGGGAVQSALTRKNIANYGISVWLKADIDLLMERVGRRDNRPLLKTEDPRGVMLALMEQRDPLYQLSDMIIESRNVPHEDIVDEIIGALAAL